MPISPERLQRDFATIAGFTQTPGAGRTCPTFSTEWGRACEYIRGELRAIGCQERIDAAGNLHARPAGVSWDEPAWLSGSHLDSVPNGGDFDGVLGVVAPLEVLRAAQQDGLAAPKLELINFAEEEGTTFGGGMLGSRALVGQLTAEQLAGYRNAAGQTYLEAGEPHGVRPELIGRETMPLKACIGFIEVHIEQGPTMWKRGTAAAVVEAIAGRRQMRCRLHGLANHAGSTPMTDRQDCVAGAAEMISALERLAPAISPQAVLTVGRFACQPNAVNVIAGEAEFSIDFRAPTNESLADGEARIGTTLREIASRRGLSFEVQTLETLPAVAMDARVCNRLREAAGRLGMAALPATTSGALHDAAILAPRVPTAMLFVASRDGISHNPAEFSRIEDIAAAVQVLAEAVGSADLA